MTKPKRVIGVARANPPRRRRRGRLSRHGRPLKSSHIDGWHWLTPSRRIGGQRRHRTPRPRRGVRVRINRRTHDGTYVKPGLKLALTGKIRMYGRGLYAARSPIGFMFRRNNAILCRVRLSGGILSNGTQYVARLRHVLWMVDARPIAEVIVRRALREIPVDLEALDELGEKYGRASLKRIRQGKAPRKVPAPLAALSRQLEGMSDAARTLDQGCPIEALGCLRYLDDTLETKFVELVKAAPRLK